MWQQINDIDKKKNSEKNYEEESREREEERERERHEIGNKMRTRQ